MSDKNRSLPKKPSAEITRELGNIREIRTFTPDGRPGTISYRINWKLDEKIINLPETKLMLANILRVLYETMLRVAITADLQRETDIIGLDGRKMKIKPDGK